MVTPDDVQEESIDETCQEKIFTTITMEGGQTIATEELQYTLECVRSVSYTHLTLPTILLV